MKHPIPYVGIAAVLCAAAVLGTEWHRDGAPIIQFAGKVDTVQLGLRDDGVVVWRKITYSTTNSPSEKTISITLTNINWGNILMIENPQYLEWDRTNNTQLNPYLKWIYK